VILEGLGGGTGKQSTSTTTTTTRKKKSEGIYTAGMNKALQVEYVPKTRRGRMYVPATARLPTAAFEDNDTEGEEKGEEMKGEEKGEEKEKGENTEKEKGGETLEGGGDAHTHVDYGTAFKGGDEPITTSVEVRGVATGWVRGRSERDAVRRTVRVVSSGFPIYLHHGGLIGPPHTPSTPTSPTSPTTPTTPGGPGGPGGAAGAAGAAAAAAFNSTDTDDGDRGGTSGGGGGDIHSAWYDFSLPSRHDLVGGSMRVKVVVYPSPVASLTAALEALIRMPCGCVEYIYMLYTLNGLLRSIVY
jgi:hypothetical protein